MNRTLDEETLECGGHSDLGLRTHNEDAFCINRELGLVIVADGVGGHDAGEVASALTCEVMEREVAAGSGLGAAIHAANTEILRAAQDGRGKHNMGSTVVAVRLAGENYEVAWVGDSRAYLWDGKLRLLTRDHSFVAQQLASGLISAEEARNHPRKHVILQAVGMQQKGHLEIGINSGRLAPGSCLLLCSDGLCDPLDDDHLSRLLEQRTTADETCRRLVNAALQRGGKDNTTAVLIAHVGAAENSHQVSETAQVVWTYDPATGSRSGLPDISMRAADEGRVGARTGIIRIKPNAITTVPPAGAGSGKAARTALSNKAWFFVFLVAALASAITVLACLLL